MDRRTFLTIAGAGAILGAPAAAPAWAGGRAAADPRHPAPARLLAGNGDPTPDTVTVPLHIVDLGPEGGYKVGIRIRLGGGEPRLYTFDTGSSGFYAARNDEWWPSYRRVGGAPIVQEYGVSASSFQYRSKIVRSLIGIPTTTGEISVETEMGQIHDAWGGSLGPRGKSSWRKDVAAGRPPLFGHFYGDFGSGLIQANGLFAVLPQLPGNLSSGFAVRLGCDGHPHDAPRLDIGLTDEIRSEVTSWVPMLGAGTYPSYPLTGRPTYWQSLFEGTYTLTQAGVTAPPIAAYSLLDTGAPTTNIHTGSTVSVPSDFIAPSGLLNPGVDFGVTAAGAPTSSDFSLSFTTGDVLGTNAVNVASVSGGGEVNLGIIPFFHHVVVFDVERGLTGFAPCH